MTQLSVISFIIAILLSIALYLHKKDIDEELNYYYLFGEHLYDQEELNKRGKTLLNVAICNTILALGNLFYMFFK